MIIANWEDAREMARRRLPKIFFDYLDGAAFSEETHRSNIADFQKWNLKQRVLRGVEKRDLSATYLGKRRPIPVMLGPVGFSGLFAPHGEIQAARAAHALGVPFCLSNYGIASLEDLRRKTDGEIWFQLYVLRDRSLTDVFLERARNARVDALCITVDTTLGGIRERDNRNGFKNLTRVTPRVLLGLMKKPGWCLRIARTGPLRINNLDGHPEYGTHVMEQAARLGKEFDPALTWDDMRAIRDRWAGKLVLKGIMSAEDAGRAASIGADAIVVSNHGGRQLDCAPSSISILPEVVNAVGSKLDVLFDGGIRRGTHVVKAMALGAKAVLLGRAYAYALAANGQNGVETLMKAIIAEIDVTIGHMGLTNVTSLNTPGNDYLWRTPH